MNASQLFERYALCPGPSRQHTECTGQNLPKVQPYQTCTEMYRQALSEVSKTTFVLALRTSQSNFPGMRDAKIQTHLTTAARQWPILEPCVCCASGLYSKKTRCPYISTSQHGLKRIVYRQLHSLHQMVAVHCLHDCASLAQVLLVWKKAS